MQKLVCGVSTEVEDDRIIFEISKVENSMMYEIAKDFVHSVESKVKLNGIIERVMKERREAHEENSVWNEKAIVLKNGVVIPYRQNMLNGEAKFCCTKCGKEFMITHDGLNKLITNVHVGNDIIGVFCSEMCERIYRKEIESIGVIEKNSDGNIVNIKTTKEQPELVVPDACSESKESIRQEIAEQHVQPTVQPTVIVPSKPVAQSSRPNPRVISEPMVQLGECVRVDGMIPTQEFPCLNCGKVVRLRGESLENFLRSKKPGPFCCPKCNKKWKKNHKSIKWKYQLPLSQQFPPQTTLGDKSNQSGPIVTMNDALNQIIPKVEIKKVDVSPVRQQQIRTPVEKLDPHMHVCPVCNKMFHMTDAQIKRRRQTERTNPDAAGPFCSRTCSIRYTTAHKQK